LEREPGKSGRDVFWRAWLARLAALVFLLQGFGLFASAPRPLATGDAFAAAQEIAAPGCFHQPRGDGHAQGAPKSCPMCQALGNALPGAPPPVIVARAAVRVILLVSPAAQRLPPPSQPLNTPPARGPPILV
jgi:hypothetical protein